MVTYTLDVALGHDNEAISMVQPELEIDAHTDLRTRREVKLKVCEPQTRLWECLPANESVITQVCQNTCIHILSTYGMQQLSSGYYWHE